MAHRAQPLHIVTRRGRLTPHLLTIPMLISLLLFAVYPVVYLIAASLSQSSLGRPFTAWVGLENYLQALSDEVFISSLIRSVVFAIWVSIIQLGLGVVIALLLYSGARRSSRIVQALILLPLMTPPIMVGVVWRLMLAPSGGLVNSTLLRLNAIQEPFSFLGTSPAAFFSIALTDIWQWTPFVALMVYAALLGQPQEVYETAVVDGASGWHIFWSITL
ncbi:MAG: sugar ABC transporter permease, partial [Chloroflexales bacterium]|nr:sugar ABC transporter permease [Chloroflexales bacterium]